MGGVADQREALGDEGARHRQPERIGAPRADRRDLAEMQAEAALQLGMERVVRQRDDALRFVGFSSVHTIDERLALQRQDGERAGGQEMLLGAAVMVALVRDGGDDAGLVVVPAVRRDAGGSRMRERAPSAATSRRARESRRRRAARRCASALVSKSAPRRRAARRPASRACAEQRVDQRPVLDHVRERLARRHLAAEGEEDRPHRVAEPAVGDHHVEDRLRLAGDRVPDADRLEHPPRRRRDGRGARVVGMARRAAPDRRP